MYGSTQLLHYSVQGAADVLIFDRETSATPCSALLFRFSLSFSVSQLTQLFFPPPFCSHGGRRIEGGRRPLVGINKPSLGTRQTGFTTNLGQQQSIKEALTSSSSSSKGKNVAFTTWIKKSNMNDFSLSLFKNNLEQGGGRKSSRIFISLPQLSCAEMCIAFPPLCLSLE